jgi:anaerobic C4-dicarboxylate transporter DcuA
MDKTGTTKIGNLVINHSFLLPGLAAMVVSIGFGFLLANILL